MTDAKPAHAERLRALGILIGGACIIGLAPILMRLTQAGPAAGGFWRLALALPVLAMLAARSSGGDLARPAPMSLMAGVMFGLDLVFWHYGVAMTSVANATVLSNLAPVVVTLFAWVFMRQRPKLLFLGALALALGGAWLLSQGRGDGGSAHVVGDLLSATTAVWYALYMLAVSAARGRDAAAKVMFWSSLVAAPIMLAAALALGEPVAPAGPGGWAACVGLALVHVAGQGSIAWALGRLPASTTSVVVLIQPVVAAILSWMLFAEALGPWQALGAALALGGVLLAQAAGPGRR